ncbi:MAG: hypothetical protein CMF38_03665 [Legionellaceae bacterium]|nr:hypothetical protein [Legionellaceae bacterium]HAF87145.1 hypothetical protein [Legionellales bacterium]HCA88747.1 hypothetical protein [Legionellales bacterium]|tara:strand:+ start:1103 stop:1792 length:690 start_codon:yes stop_codon:yes gene_type:complete
MNKYALLGASLILSLKAQADVSFLLDTVHFQVSAHEWVKTESALLKVNIHATLNNTDLVKARNTIMSHLAKIAQGSWHITQFNRTQDSSGLEKLYAQAQIRVPQAKLTQVYQDAKAISKPGMSYTVDQIVFTPSLADTKAAETQLRERLYQEIKQELIRLNEVYTDQHYTINRLEIANLTDDATPQVPTNNARVLMAVAKPKANYLPLANRLTLTATVEAASNRSNKSA